VFWRAGSCRLAGSTAARQALLDTAALLRHACPLSSGQIKDGHAHAHGGSCRVTGGVMAGTHTDVPTIKRSTVESARSSWSHGSNHGSRAGWVRGFTVRGARSMTSSWHSFCSVRLCFFVLSPCVTLVRHGTHLSGDEIKPRAELRRGPERVGQS
jgi:hypothetical protein